MNTYQNSKNLLSLKIDIYQYDYIQRAIQLVFCEKYLGCEELYKNVFGKIGEVGAFGPIFDVELDCKSVRM